jgi:hypothetical protein
MTKTSQPDAPATAPRFDAFHIQEGDEKSYWTKIGAAWPNADGKGYNIVLNCLPIDGKITLRLYEPKPEEPR